MSTPSSIKSFPRLSRDGKFQECLFSFFVWIIFWTFCWAFLGMSPPPYQYWDVYTSVFLGGCTYIEVKALPSFLHEHQLPWPWPGGLYLFGRSMGGADDQMGGNKHGRTNGTTGFETLVQSMFDTFLVKQEGEQYCELKERLLDEWCLLYEIVFSVVFPLRWNKFQGHLSNQWF